MDTSLFSSDYLSARDRFRAAALRLGCELEAHSVGERSPDGDDLCIDVAIRAGNSDQRMLLVTSGMHGVEGFFGSALQLGLLEEWIAHPERRPASRCVFVHALNPYGFAWRRRVNETNVDLNRNFLLASEAYRGSPPGYSRLDDLLNPRHGPARWEPVAVKLLAAIVRHGMPALKQAVASGQYEYPRGLFYGGGEASRTNRILEANFERWLGNAEKVFHLDLHTGLGRWANFKLFVDQALSDAQQHWLARHFGPDTYETPETQKVAFPTRGNLLRWGYAHRGGREYLAAVAEFGTYSVLRVVAALRAENQCHHWQNPADAVYEDAKRELVEVFCPRSDAWRLRVLERGHRLIERAIAGLSPGTI
jgi:hypothetical protein